MVGKLTRFEAEVLRQKVDGELAEKGFGQKDFNIKLSQLARLWDLGLDLSDDSASRPSQPYRQVGLVFRCIEKLIAEMISLQLVLSTADEKIIESGPAYDLLFNNPKRTWQQFVTEAIGHYALSRDVFFVFTAIDNQAKPTEIQIVSGAQMRAITRNNRPDGDLIAWEFWGSAGQRATFDPAEVVQWKNFNPYDRFHGIGPATAAKLDIDYSYAAALYNSSSLANGAEPGAILTMPGSPTEDQIIAVRTNFNSRHAGAGKTKRTALLTGGMDIKTIAMKMADMQVAEITNMSDKKICSAFGVPPELLGLATEAQYAGGPAQRNFIFGTIMPLAAGFANVITSGIVSQFTTSKFSGDDFPLKSVEDSLLYGGLRRSLAANKFFRDSRRAAVATQKKVFTWFDFSQHPTVQEVTREVADKVLKFTQSGVKLNDVIEAHDLPYEQVPWGDDWWISAGQMPARFTLEAGLEGLTGPQLPEGQTPGETPPKAAPVPAIADITGEVEKDEQQRLRLWRNWVISWAGIEREFTEAMRTFFVRQQRVLIQKLRAAMSEGSGLAAEQLSSRTGEQVKKRNSTAVNCSPVQISGKAAKADAEEIISRVVFDLAIENGKIKLIHQTFFLKAAELGVRQTLSEILGLSGDKLNEAAEQALKLPAIRRSLLISSQKISGVNRTTQNMVANQLRTGLKNGEGLNDLTRRIQTTLGSNRKRAQSIARTQTGGAVSSGRHVGLRQSGQNKAWVDAHDDDVRDSHKEAARKYAGGIPIDQAFEVGGAHLMYPGDPSGPAEEIINCRCLEIAVKADGKTIDSNYPFYTYSDMQKDSV